MGLLQSSSGGLGCIDLDPIDSVSTRHAATVTFGAARHQVTESNLIDLAQVGIDYPGIGLRRDHIVDAGVLSLAIGERTLSNLAVRNRPLRTVGDQATQVPEMRGTRGSWVMPLSDPDVPA